MTLSLLRRLGVLKTRRLVTRESTVFQDRYRNVRMAAYRAAYKAYGAQDLVIAQTDYMADRLRELLPVRACKLIRVVPNPVDLAELARAAAVPLEPELAAILKRRPHVVWCGRMIDLKRPNLAIDALSALRSAHGIDAGLVMIGDGALREAVRSRADSLGLADFVTLTGSRANPYPVMTACWLGLLTSRREGFPNVLLEMMACGVPGIVTTDCAGDLETLAGVTIAEGTAEALAGSLASALTLGRTPADSSRLYSETLKRRGADAFTRIVCGFPEEAESI